MYEYAGPLVGFWAPGLKRTPGYQWEIDPEHFSERFQQFVIIVLGESIVRVGAPAADLEFTTARFGALVTAFTLTAFLWWLYFDEVAERSREHLIQHDEEQGRLARDAYTYLHMPIVAGVPVVAVGNEPMIEDPSDALQGLEVWVLAIGLSSSTWPDTARSVCACSVTSGGGASPRRR